MMQFSDDTTDVFEPALERRPVPIDDAWIETLCLVLARTRRREALRGVFDADDALSVETLADRIDEHGVVDSSTTEVSVLLHHADLPMLADAGLVRHDREAGTVEATTSASAIVTALSKLAANLS